MKWQVLVAVVVGLCAGWYARGLLDVEPPAHQSAAPAVAPANSLSPFISRDGISQNIDNGTDNASSSVSTSPIEVVDSVPYESERERGEQTTQSLPDQFLALLEAMDYAGAMALYSQYQALEGERLKPALLSYLNKLLSAGRGNDFVELSDQ